jgi:hypothetical protein
MWSQAGGRMSVGEASIYPVVTKANGNTILRCPVYHRLRVYSSWRPSLKLKSTTKSS